MLSFQLILLGNGFHVHCICKKKRVFYTRKMKLNLVFFNKKSILCSYYLLLVFILIIYFINYYDAHLWLNYNFSKFVNFVLF